jgi:Uri superfamily endonuclease
MKSAAYLGVGGLLKRVSTLLSKVGGIVEMACSTVSMPIRSHKGTYALLLNIRHPASLEIGCLGHVTIPSGYYLYVGSAFGPGGLKARISHHLVWAQRDHWHIDYLKKVGKIEEIWYTYDSVKREHQWAAMLQALEGAEIPLFGFGATDCKCQTHLFSFSRPPSAEHFQKLLTQKFKGHGQIRVDKLR